MTLLVLIGIAEVLLRTSQLERGMELLALVFHHPASNQETKAQAEQLAAQYKGILLPEVHAAAWEHGMALHLDMVVQEQLAELQMIKQLPDELLSIKDLLRVSANQSLADPLTPRELDVLRLLAAGQSNRNIASHLVITRGTVRGHLNKLYHKLSVENRVQAVICAQQLGLL